MTYFSSFFFFFDYEIHSFSGSYGFLVLILWQFVFYLLNNIDYLYPGNGPSALPDQVFGLYFGWAKVDTHESFKVVVCIGWDQCSCIAKRKFVSIQSLTVRLAFLLCPYMWTVIEMGPYHYSQIQHKLFSKTKNYLTCKTFPLRSLKAHQLWFTLIWFGWDQHP